ncbi:MAG: MATE family efflux transporter [Lachnospiraceae bacterium]|nr:MATE family efflux transporter [Lachnospiraceae bacterium]
MNKDLTVGRPETVLWKFCLPLFGSVIFQQLYNIADSLVAGNFIGEQALAAVGNSYEITLIFMAFAFGCNIGCSVITSQLFGAKKEAEMKTAVSTAMIATAVLCAILMTAGLIFSGRLLEMIHTPGELMADSRLYLVIYIWGLPFMMFYNIANGIFSALGDSRTPFLFLACSSVANIVVDIFFVAGLKMGVAGVAWATFLCQGISAVLAMTVVLKRMRKIAPGEKTPVFSWRLLRKIGVIAIPSILQQSCISVGNILIQGMINGFGSGVMAGYSAAIKLNNLVITSFTTIGNGISNYTAQNYGAGKTQRIRAGFKAGWKLIWMLSVPFMLLYFFWGRGLTAFFMKDASEAALGSGLTFLRIVTPFYLVVSLKLVADGILRGTGTMKRFMTTTMTDLVLRVVLARILSGTALGSVGIWCAWPLGWLVATSMSVYFCTTGPWFREKASQGKN